MVILPQYLTFTLKLVFANIFFSICVFQFEIFGILSDLTVHLIFFDQVTLTSEHTFLLGRALYFHVESFYTEYCSILWNVPLFVYFPAEAYLSFFEV